MYVISLPFSNGPIIQLSDMQGTRSVSLSLATLRRRRVRLSHKTRIRVGPLPALVVHGLVGLIHRRHKFL
jgi:hypothetical protein